MKRMILFLSAAFVSLSIFAKQAQTSILASAKQAPTTILVMDSANALLHDVCITAKGYEPFTTSFDGRYVMGLPLQNDLLLTLVAPLRDTVRFTLTPTMQGQTVIIRMGERHYPEIVVGYGKPMMASMIAPETAEDAYIVEEEEAADMAVVDAASATEEKVFIRGMANTLPSAGKLTAGEVNDFAKWALWPKLLDGSHSNYLQDWQMVPRNRYVVQLTNTQGYPIVDRSVSLTDTKGNTLFQARTDNTGKAELWDGLFETNI